MRGTAVASAVVLAAAASLAARAFVGLGSRQPLRVAREVAVTRAGKSKFGDGVWDPNKKEDDSPPETPEVGLARTMIALETRSDEELHGKIAAARQDLWEGRLNVFRRKPPNVEQKYRNRKEIARANTILSARRNAAALKTSMDRREELRAAKKMSEEQFEEYLELEGPLMTATRDVAESINAMKAFSHRGGKRQQNKKAGTAQVAPFAYGGATPRTFKRADWFYISPEQREQMAEELKARRDQGEWETLIEDTKAATAFGEERIAAATKERKEKRQAKREAAEA